MQNIETFNREKKLNILKAMLMDAKNEQLLRRAEMSKYKPANDDELHRWIKDVIGIDMVREATQDGHQTPFQFIADAFFERKTYLVEQGPRGGGKTIGFAILAFLCLLFKPDMWIVYVGGTQKQADDGYNYIAGDKKKSGKEGLLRGELFKELLAEEPRVGSTVMNNGAHIEVRTGGSDKSVSGPHPQLLLIDEVDYIEKGTLGTALQMPMSNSMYKAVVAMGSSQYGTSGTLKDIIDSAEDSGIAVYRFDVFDLIQNCGKRYPTDCGTCPLYKWRNPFKRNIEEELCKGRASRASGHIAYTDVCARISGGTDSITFALQNLLLDGHSQGMMYPQYGEHNNKTFDFSSDDLLDWKCHAGVDMRGHGRIVVIAEAPYTNAHGKKIRWVIDEWMDDANTPSKLIAACKTMKAKVINEFGLHISAFYAEPSATDMIKDFPKDLNAQTVSNDTKNISYGIGIIRDAFLSADGEISLYIDKERCPLIHKAISEGYRCKRLPDGSYDFDNAMKNSGNELGEHFADALRYAMVSKSTIATSFNEDFIVSIPKGTGFTLSGAGNRWNPT